MRKSTSVPWISVMSLDKMLFMRWISGSFAASWCATPLPALQAEAHTATPKALIV
jgi:hypothetical protein